MNLKAATVSSIHTPKLVQEPAEAWNYKHDALVDALSKPEEIIQRIYCPEDVSKELRYLLIEHQESKQAASGMIAYSQGNLVSLHPSLDLSKYLPVFQTMNSRVFLNYFRPVMKLTKNLVFNSILDFYNTHIISALRCLPHGIEEI